MGCEDILSKGRFSDRGPSGSPWMPREIRFWRGELETRRLTRRFPLLLGTEDDAKTSRLRCPSSYEGVRRRNRGAVQCQESLGVMQGTEDTVSDCH
jgi:hypothetical protein